MPEVRLVHFPHRWEAEFAKGFLDDAGVPSRVLSDGAAGGQPYVGGLSGASLLVPRSQEQEARTVLEGAGVLETAAPMDIETQPVEERLSPTQRADWDDLNERLRVARKAETKHGIRSMLGMTPAALIPLVGLLREGNTELIALLCVLVVFVEGWRWIQAGREVRRIQVALQELEDEAAPG